MENNNLRPTSLSAVAGKESLGGNIRSRANMLRGLTAPGAQMNNTDNYESIAIRKLVTFSLHPFNVNDDAELEELTESIRESGLMEAIIVRPLGDGFYEILAGHRRVAACKKLGWDDIAARVLNVDDNEAVIIMTNTNLKRRKKILPSERAKAYKMQLEAYKCQGKRSDLLNSIANNMDFGQNLPKVSSRDLVAEMNNTTAREVSCYIRLNELNQYLLEYVDCEQIPFYAGVALSFLLKEEQQLVYEAIQTGTIKKLDIKAAEELKSISKQGQLNEMLIKQLFAKMQVVKPQNTYEILQTATKQALKQFKKLNYGDVDVDKNEMEQVILEAVRKYVEERTELRA